MCGTGTQKHSGPLDVHHFVGVGGSCLDADVNLGGRLGRGGMGPSGGFMEVLVSRP